jgi:hypothetical protein
MENTYAAIGRAVIAAQMFEKVLVPVYEGFKMITDQQYLEKTSGYIPIGAYKSPIKNIVKFLSAKGSIAPDLEARLTRYVDDRNTLVHSLILEIGWPDESDADGIAKVTALAKKVEFEAKYLESSLTGYIVQHVAPLSDSASSVEYKARMADIFHKANLES